MIYLDNAATYIDDKKEVLDVYLNALNMYPANSNSFHRLGYITNKALDEARKDVIKTLKINNDYDVIFTSGATEGINYAIKGYCLRNKNRGNEIICFKNEHPSVLESVKYFERLGFKINFISPKENGEIDYDELKAKINDRTILVSVICVNNEIGSINDIKKIKEIVNNYPKCVFFSDVTQSIGKIDIDYNLLDMFAFSAHKFGGLIGSGILVKKKKIILEKQMLGGSQENNYRSGTVATPLAISTVFALNRAIKLLNEHYNHAQELKNYLLQELNKIDEVVINSDSSFPYLINFSLKHKKASVVIEALSNKEIYVSSLSACNAKQTQVSYVLTNIGKNKQLAENSIRVSFSRANTIDEVRTFIAELKNILGAIR